MYYSSLGHLLCIRNGKVMNKMLNNTISILLLPGGGVPEGGGGR